MEYELEINEFKSTPEAFNMLKEGKPTRGKFKTFVDCFGNNIWHYLTRTSNPIETFKVWGNKIKNEDYNLLNNRKLHFMDYLYMKGDEESILFFEKTLPNLKHSKDGVVLYSCISKNEHFIAETILKNNTKVNFQNEDQESAIKFITLLYGIGLLKTILDEGADPNILDKQNKTPLHYAANIYDIDKYNLLEDYYADDKIKTITGQTAPQILERSESRELIEIDKIIKKWENQLEKMSDIFY